MRTLVRVLAAALVLAVADVAAAQVATGRLNEIKREFAYNQAVKTSEPVGAANAPASEEEAKRYHEFRMQQQKDKVIFAGLLGVLALIAHVVVLRFLPRTASGAMHIVGATGLVYIVFGTIILVVIANTEAQLTAAMGILGAFAGYLFGRFRRDEGPEGEGTASASSAAKDGPAALKAAER